MSGNHISLKERIYQGILDRSLFAAIWLPVAAFGIYAKTQILTNRGDKQWIMLAHAFHRASTPPASSHFSFYERISLFSYDFLFGFVLVPLILVLALAILPRKLWGFTVGLISVLTSVLIFLQMLSFKNIGHFIPWYLISAAAHWAYQHPQFVIEYSSRQALMILALLSGTIAALALSLPPRDRTAQTQPFWKRALARTVIGVAVASILFGIWGMRSALAKTWYGRAEIPEILSATFHGYDDMGSGATVKSAEQLSREYTALADSQRDAQDPRYWAKASGYDVIVFMLETAPARYDSFESLEDLPTLKQLSERSWIGNSHYTTFPYTAKATFSILTSMYPPNPLFFGGAPKQAPGLVRALSSAGYETRYYVPHKFENDFEDAMYAAIGFDKIFTSQPIQGPMPIGDQFYEDKIRCDVDALNAMMADIHEQSQQNHRYLAVISPQIGHAPWPQVEQLGREMSLGQRMRALLRLQDRWLGRIVRQLSKDGRLDHTIIVVAGDHGIRTATEDPSYDPHGLLPDYSFHVPLLIFAPQVLDHGEKINAVTSHVDVVPTVLDLIGIKQERAFEQGLPVWNAGLRERKVFLWAGDYLGAEGFEQKGEFKVWNKVADFVFTGPSLDEKVLRMSDVGSADQSDIDDTLRAMAKLDGDWWVSAMPPKKTPDK